MPREKTESPAQIADATEAQPGQLEEDAPTAIVPHGDEKSDERTKSSGPKAVGYIRGYSNWFQRIPPGMSKANKRWLTMLFDNELDFSQVKFKN
jgi:hypothetical protein